MPDIADERSAVRDAMRRAEEAAGIFRDDSGNEVYGDPTTTPDALPELEGAVPVSASDQPLPVEPVEETDTSTEQVEEPQAEAPAPGVVQSAEELQAEVARLQEQLTAKESMIGRQSTDVGELRAELDALRAQVNAAPTTTTPPAPQVVITQDMIENNPAYAAQLAYEQNNGQALAAAIEAWKEEDPFAAASWRADKLLERKEAEFAERLAEVRGEVAQVRAPLEQNAEQTAWSNAFLEMQKAYPDFLTADAEGKTNAQRLLEEVAPQFPAVAQLIANGDVGAKVQGLTLLYEKGKLGNPTQVAEELQAAANEAAAEAERARAAASVVNGQSTAGQDSNVELTEEQAEIERYKSRYSGGVSLSRGWTGRA